MSIPCPCGGGLAYNRDELIAQDTRPVNGKPASEDWRRQATNMWHQVLAPDDYYCPHEDDVLLETEVQRILRGGP